MPTDSTAPSRTAAGLYEFGPFRFDVATRSLYRGTAFIALTPKAAEMLLVLVEDAGRVVTKEQLMARVWPGVIVEEGGIANQISALRRVFGSEFGDEGPIATVARRGYRFTAQVRTLGVAELGARSAVDVLTDNGLAPAVLAAAPAPVREAAPESPAAPPKITERDTVLLGDIENRTGDAIFDGTLKQALLMHLAQSPFLEILPDRRVHSALQLMKRPSSTPVVGEAMLEICQRTGATAAISGWIFGLGGEYVIGLTAVHGESGEMLVSEQARANGKAEVLKALDSAALSLRSKLGESLASVRRYSGSFDEVATSSLEALKAYSIGRRAWFERGDGAAIPHQMRAIELDPHFASAYSALAIAYMNVGQSTRATEYLLRAYQLRDRVSERERCRIVAAYHQMATGDAHKALDAYRVWMQGYPRDATASTNASNMYMTIGQWETALDHAQAAHRGELTNVSAGNLAIILLALERPDEARATIEHAFAQGVDAYYLRLDAYQEAFLRGDTDAMQRHADTVMGRRGEEDFLIATQADTEAYFGRVARSRVLARRAVESAARADATEMSAIWQALAALREAELGYADLACEAAAAALATASGRTLAGLAGYALARAGASGAAAKVAADLDKEFPQDTQVQRYWLPGIRAAIALAAGQWEEAVDALEQASRLELGLVPPFEGGLLIPIYLRGMAYLAGKRGEEAAREFHKIVERPGLIKNFVLHPLAVLGEARALAMAGRAKESAAAYARFLETWKSADEGLAILADARRESANLEK